MFDASGINGYLKSKLWCEAFNTAVDVINITPYGNKEKLRCELWDDNIPLYARDLKRFGEIGIVKKLCILQKMESKGFDAMFIGYSQDHAKEVYRMLNLSTNKVSTTRDIKWMELTYKEYMNKIGEDNTTESSIKIINNNDQSEEELEIENVISHENDSNQDEPDEEKEDDSSSSVLKCYITFSDILIFYMSFIFYIRYVMYVEVKKKMGCLYL